MYPVIMASCIMTCTKTESKRKVARYFKVLSLIASACIHTSSEDQTRESCNQRNKQTESHAHIKSYHIIGKDNGCYLLSCQIIIKKIQKGTFGGLNCKTIKVVEILSDSWILLLSLSLETFVDVFYSTITHGILSHLLGLSFPFLAWLTEDSLNS